MKYRSIFSQISKSAMTPSLSGRMAWMFDGVRPIIRFASAPTASGRPSLMSTATTDGSLRTMPRPRTYTSVLAVPRSTAMSRPRRERRFSAIVEALPRNTGWVPASTAPLMVRPQAMGLRGGPQGGRTKSPIRPAITPALAGCCVAWALRGRQVREEEGDFPRRRLVRVGAVNEVLGRLDPVVAANGSRSRLSRVRGAHHQAHHGVGVLRTLHDQDERRRSGDEGDHVAEERPLGMLGVMALGDLLRNGPELGGHEAQPLALEAADHLAGQAPLNAVGLHNDKGAVHEGWTLHKPRGPVRPPSASGFLPRNGGGERVGASRTHDVERPGHHHQSVGVDQAARDAESVADVPLFVDGQPERAASLGDCGDRHG